MFIFYAISVWFVECGCDIRAAGGTKNFGLLFSFFRQPAQIHIHVHMCLAGTSLCQRCQMPDKILAALKMHPYFGEPPRYIPIIKIYHFSQLQKHFLNRFRYKNTLPRNACSGIECFTLKMVKIYFIKTNQNVRIPYAITVYFNVF